MPRILTVQQLTTSKRLRRVIWHWTGGTYTPNTFDKAAYNLLVAHDTETSKASIVTGDHPLEAQIPKPVLESGAYAAHTSGTNSYSAGIAIAAMNKAVQKPLSYGLYPPTRQQLDVLVRATADICEHHDIEVAKHTVLNHSEVESVLGTKQHNKWDIDALPFIEGGATNVHNWMRAQVSSLLAAEHVEKYVPTAIVQITALNTVKAQCAGVIDNSSVYAPLPFITKTLQFKVLLARPDSVKVFGNLQFADLAVKRYSFSGDEPYVSIREVAQKFTFGLKWSNPKKTLALIVA